MAGEMVDVDKIAQMASGEYWSGMTEEQKERRREYARDFIAAVGLTPAHKRLEADRERKPATDAQLCALMRAALLEFWNEQGLAYQEDDLPSDYECMRMIVAIRPFFYRRAA